MAARAAKRAACVREGVSTSSSSSSSSSPSPAGATETLEAREGLSLARSAALGFPPERDTRPSCTLCREAGRARTGSLMEAGELAERARRSWRRRSLRRARRAALCGVRGRGLGDMVARVVLSPFVSTLAQRVRDPEGFSLTEVDGGAAVGDVVGVKRKSKMDQRFWCTTASHKHGHWAVLAYFLCPHRLLGGATVIVTRPQTATLRKVRPSHNNNTPGCKHPRARPLRHATHLYDSQLRPRAAPLPLFPRQVLGTNSFPWRVLTRVKESGGMPSGLRCRD